MAYRGTHLDDDLIRSWPKLDADRKLRRPDTRENIEAGLRGRGDITENFIRAGDLWVPRAAARDPALVAWGAAEHPRGLAYELDALTRVRMALIR
ncbi:hypothetical protein [Corynebacterium sp.]|uniref:hypothetical protein n=1 Tax=Corynebacterium sp. TaxID=1720 RepID=UPI0028B0ACE7|nr:hypothetical protein [Corynebacterium sp.]